MRSLRVSFTYLEAIRVVEAEEADSVRRGSPRGAQLPAVWSKRGTHPLVGGRLKICLGNLLP